MWVQKYKLPAQPTSTSATAKPLILQSDNYVSICDKSNGKIYLVEGPRRLVLKSNEVQIGEVRHKLILKPNEYIILRNPYNFETQTYAMGARSVVKGPTTRSLYPSEILEDNIVKKARILKHNQALVIQAIRDFDEPSPDPSKPPIKRKASEKWLVTGPTMYIESPYIKIVDEQTHIVVAENQAIYVMNTLTSEIRMVRGPCTYMLQVNEKLWNKKVSKQEYLAGVCGDLESSPSPSNSKSRKKSQGFSKSSKSSKRSSSWYSYKGSHFAPVISLESDEICAIISWNTQKVRYLEGPRTYLLGQHEGVKILSIAGGVPKRDNQILLYKISLGPANLIDRINVRTSDNAEIELELSYRWKFLLDATDFQLPFQMPDPFGFVCHSMRSRIREAVSSVDFETFHAGSVSLLRKKLFKTQMFKGQEIYGRFFKQFNFLISEIDIQSTKHVDIEIERLRNRSLQASMKIYCDRLEFSARHDSEKQQILADVELATLRQDLIKQQLTNLKTEREGTATVTASKMLETARGQVEASELITKQQNEAEITEMKQKIDLLSTPQGLTYLKLKQVEAMNNVKSAQIIPKGIHTIVMNSQEEL